MAAKIGPRSTQEKEALMARFIKNPLKAALKLLLAMAFLWLSPAWGQPSGAVAEFYLKATIKNELSQGISALIRPRSNTKGAEGSNPWREYRIDGGETIEIICPKCDRRIHIFEAAIRTSGGLKEYWLYPGSFSKIARGQAHAIFLFYPRVHSTVYYDAQ